MPDASAVPRGAPAPRHRAALALASLRGALALPARRAVRGGGRRDLCGDRVVAIFADEFRAVRSARACCASTTASRSYLPISAAHWLGTTADARDILSQLIYGTRAALEVGLTAAFCVVAIGTLLGLLAGYLGGWIDKIIIRLADIVLGLPFLPVAAGAGGADHARRTLTIVVTVGALLWPNTARVIRSQVLSLRERAWVDAARVTGCSSGAHHVRARAAAGAAAGGAVRIGGDRLGDPGRGGGEFPRLRRSGQRSVGA